MSDSPLSRLSYTSLNEPPALTSTQTLVDSLVGGFVEQATDLRSLAAMTAGGMAFRLGRVGVMATGAGRLASLGIGLGAEVTAFEMTNRSLSSFTGESHRNPNLWRWEGQGGLRQGLLSSLITFGSLKGAGALAQGENVLVQHLLQDTGMVLGHNASAALGITPTPMGSLAEQFLHAEATNLQLGAGMALGHGLTGGGLHALERGLDLSLPQRDVQPFFYRFFPRGPQLALATSSTVETNDALSPAPKEEPGIQIAMMSGKDTTSQSIFPGPSEGGIAPSSPNRIEIPGLEMAFLLPPEGSVDEGIRDFIEMSPVPMTVAEMGSIYAMALGKMLMVNRAFCKAFGYPPHEAMEKSVSAFFPASDLFNVVGKVRKILSGGIFPPTALKFQHRDGHYIHITGSGVIRNIYGRDTAFGFLEPASEDGSPQRANPMMEMLRSTDRRNEIRQGADGAIEFHSLMGINIQLMDPKSPLLSRLVRENLVLRITGNLTTPESLREYIPTLIRTLNTRSQLTPFSPGRTLRIEMTTSRASVTLQRKSNDEGFVVMKENLGGPRLAKTQGREEPTGFAAAVRILGGEIPEKK